MVYGYARVSTAGQARDGAGLDAQEKALKEHGAQEIYLDVCTGAKNQRPRLAALLGRIKAGDTFLVTKLDRMARSAQEGLQLVDSLKAKGVRVHILNLGVLDESPMGRCILTVFLAFAEFERDTILARTQEGKALARQKPGFAEGRPKKFTPHQLGQAIALLETHSYKQVAAMTQISKSTLQRAKRGKN